MFIKMLHYSAFLFQNIMNLSEDGRGDLVSCGLNLKPTIGLIVCCVDCSDFFLFCLFIFLSYYFFKYSDYFC